MRRVKVLLDDPAEYVMLAPREREALRLVCAAKMDKEIALAMGISRDGVKMLLAGVRRGLGLATRQELILWAIQHPSAMSEPPAACSIVLHRPGCECGSVYCMAMREALKAA